MLAGGSGTRLYPVTKGISKQLLPVFDKPMIYYPISVLMLSEIRDIAIITTPSDLSAFERLLGDGSDFGINLSYIIQPSPDGLAQAFILAEEFIGNDPVCMILGDNLFYGLGFSVKLKAIAQKLSGATVFGYNVNDPQRFGIVTIDNNGRPISIDEKPKSPASNIAVTGLYFYDNDVVDIAKSVRPSKRGELEITSVNQVYLENERLDVELLGRGFAWLDTGTHESLLEASSFVQAIENRQGLKIACLEEIALQNNWLDIDRIISRANEMDKSSYGQYLLKLAREKL